MLMRSRMAVLVFTASMVATLSSCSSESPAPPPATTVANVETRAGNRPPAVAAPEALVADLYEQHRLERGPFFQTTDRALVEKYFEQQTADLIWNDATGAGEGVGAIGFDPLYYAQDLDIKDLRIEPANMSGTSASVVVHFENMGEKNTITYIMARSEAGWRIRDIAYGDGASLLAILRG